MQIDWLTVVAQIVNFLILVWLLKRFLYQPVIHAMTQREQRITARLHEAQQREDQAEAERRRFEEQARELARAREETLAEARTAADEEKRHLLDEARREIGQQRDEWREALRREVEDLRQAIERELAESAVRIARRALADLADEELERRIVARFLRRLESLSEEERRPFMGSDEPLRIATTFDMDDESREWLRKALGAPARIEYVRDPELVCGIALTSSGHRLDGSITAYLDDAEERIREQLVVSASEHEPADEERE
jgi:F-type H+-transporting ATPase subunit b